MGPTTRAMTASIEARARSPTVQASLGARCDDGRAGAPGGDGGAIDIAGTHKARRWTGERAACRAHGRRQTPCAERRHVGYGQRTIRQSSILWASGAETRRSMLSTSNVTRPRRIWATDCVTLMVFSSCGLPSGPDRLTVLCGDGIPYSVCARNQRAPSSPTDTCLVGLRRSLASGNIPCSPPDPGFSPKTWFKRT